MACACAIGVTDLKMHEIRPCPLMGKRKQLSNLRFAAPGGELNPALRYHSAHASLFLLVPGFAAGPARPGRRCHGHGAEHRPVPSHGHALVQMPSLDEVAAMAAAAHHAHASLVADAQPHHDMAAPTRQAPPGLSAAAPMQPTATATSMKAIARPAASATRRWPTLSC